MKLNKKKELYVNAIIGGNMPAEKQCERLINTGLMYANVTMKRFDAPKEMKWNREALTTEPLRDLKLLYTVLNG